MKTKTILFFAIAFAVSFLAATYRWGDSAHSIGTIKAQGGRARHPSFLHNGEKSYMLIATATVIPPYKGDVKIALEGYPRIAYMTYLSGPAIDLGIRKLPTLDNNVIHGLQPRDRIALWVKMIPPAVDPVCGMPWKEGFTTLSHQGKDYIFCSTSCSATFRRNPERFRDNDSLKGSYRLSFYDTKTERPVLRIPLTFTGKEGENVATAHQH